MFTISSDGECGILDKTGSDQCNSAREFLSLPQNPAWAAETRGARLGWSAHL